MSGRYGVVRDLWEISDDEEWGHDDAALDEWRERFGAVPAALAEWFVTLGAHSALNETQDQLVQPAGTPHARFTMDGDDDTEMLVFYVENQLAVQWGIAASDVTDDDPRVYLLTDGRWEPTRDSVSAFLIAQAHLQWLFASADWSEDFLDVDVETMERLRRFLPPRGVEADLYGGVEFFGGPGVMLAHFRDSSSVVFGCADHHLLSSLWAFFART